MSISEPHNQVRCSACGGFLEAESRGELRILKLNRVVMRDVAKVDQSLAADLRAARGVLPLHPTCKHPVEEYFFKEENP